jgi:hypothetical protein
MSLLGLGFPAAANSAVTVIDPVWQKTSNFQYEDTAIYLGSTAFPVNDPSWSWTSTVWDGLATNGDGTAIPDYTNDFWAFWVHNPVNPWDWSKVTHSWFKTCFTLPKGKLNSVKLVNKYNQDILSINDNLYVYVNNSLAASGGTAAVGWVWNNYLKPNNPPLPSLPLGFVAGTYPQPPDGIAVETGGWRIPGGLSLATTAFTNCNANEITILMEDYNQWGGVGHLVFVVDYDPTQLGLTWGQWLPPIATSNKQMKAGSTLPVKFTITDPCGPVDDSEAQPHVLLDGVYKGIATSLLDPITGLPYFQLNIKLPPKGPHTLNIQLNSQVIQSIDITTK